MKFEFKEHTDRGLVREVNEDNLGHELNSINGDIFVVCDGMGGHVGGKTASTIGVQSIITELTKKQHGNMHVAISQALIFANEQVLGYAASEPSLKGMGSTATVALIKDNLLYVGHVGDSRAYIFSDGKLYRITRDDSYVQGLVDNGVITEDEAETHPNKNRILQALGSTSAISPRIPNKPFKLKTGDLLLLCSDGLTSMVVDELIEQLIDPNSIQQTLEKLHEIAMVNGGKDNITMTLIKITDSPFNQSDFDHFTMKYKQSSSTSTSQFSANSTSIEVEPSVKRNQRLVLLIGVLAVLVLAVIGIWKFKYNDPNNDTNAGNGGSIEGGKAGNDTTEMFVTSPEHQGTSNNNDNDNDGVTNDKDRCPNEKGPKDNNGCPKVDPKLQPLIKDSIQKDLALHDLFKKYSKGEYNNENFCNNCADDSTKRSCDDQVKLARQKYNKACQELKKARKRGN